MAKLKVKALKRFSAFNNKNVKVIVEAGEEVVLGRKEAYDYVLKAGYAEVVSSKKAKKEDA